MNRAAEKVYNVLRQEGTQKSVIDIMQTRNELYESINYYQFEEKLDALYTKSRPDKRSAIRHCLMAAAPYQAYDESL